MKKKLTNIKQGYEIKIIKDKMKRIFCIWQAPDSPLRNPDAIGPFLIFLLTPIFYSLKEHTSKSYYVHLLVYMIFEVIGLFFMASVASYKMINCTIPQIANIYIYSQVWWIVFCPFTLFVSGRAINTILLLCIPLIVLSAKRLGSMIIPEDISIFYALFHIIPAILIFCWTFIP